MGPTLRNNGRAAAESFGRSLGRRYHRFQNIVWLNGNDFNHWKDPVADGVVQAVARGIRAADPGTLQTVELNIYTSSSFDDPTWVPLVQLNGTYTYSATYIQMLHSYNQTPVAPTYLLEAHYEFDDIGKPLDFGNPEVLRREEYWTMLSGGKGQLYRYSYGWTFMPGWQLYVDAPGVTQLKIWKQFFSSLPWQDLVPDQHHSVVTAGFGTFGDLKTAVSKSNFCTSSRTPDGTFVVAYMPTMREITDDMASLKAPAIARWFDPTSGVYTVIAGGPLSNHGERKFTPPGKNHDGNGDWVLVLDASGVVYRSNMTGKWFSCPRGRTMLRHRSLGRAVAESMVTVDPASRITTEARRGMSGAIRRQTPRCKPTMVDRHPRTPAKEMAM